MKTDNLVNGYVLTNLLYELMFLDENGVVATDVDWGKSEFVAKLICDFILPRYASFKEETKQVIKNTLGYLLVVEAENSELWDVIWQACSAPIPTPKGIPAFMLQCYEILFHDEFLPTESSIKSFHVSHDAQMANRLN